MEYRENSPSRMDISQESLLEREIEYMNSRYVRDRPIQRFECSRCHTYYRENDRVCGYTLSCCGDILCDRCFQFKIQTESYECDDCLEDSPNIKYRRKYCAFTVKNIYVDIHQMLNFQEIMNVGNIYRDRFRRIIESEVCSHDKENICGLKLLVIRNNQPVIKNKVNFMMEGNQIYDRKLVFEYYSCSKVFDYDIELLKQIRRFRYDLNLKLEEIVKIKYFERYDEAQNKEIEKNKKIIKKQKELIKKLQKELDDGFEFDLVQNPANKVTKKISKRRQ